MAPTEVWYPGAIRRPGPSWKTSGFNPNDGATIHSAEGFLGGLLYELDRPDRSASWHFSVMTDGTVYQHYPIDVVCHHSADWGGDNDGANGNGGTIGIEHAGMAGTEFTDAQYRATAGIIKWAAKQGAWIPTRQNPGKTLFEHRELSDTGTACPSNRCKWIRLTALLTAPIPPKKVEVPKLVHPQSLSPNFVAQVDVALLGMGPKTFSLGNGLSGKLSNGAARDLGNYVEYDYVVTMRTKK